MKPDFEMGFCVWVWTCGSANWGATCVVDWLTWVYWGFSKMGIGWTRLELCLSVDLLGYLIYCNYI